jgi:hypothetical protein
MVPSRAIRPRTVASRRLAFVATCLLIVWWGSARSIVRGQRAPHADANQLHAAIANGDIESLRYWLTVRHADASAANAAEPDITPLDRCLGLASLVLDARPDAERDPRGTPSPPVSLRTLQSMVALLYEHGARLTEIDRRRFSGPVLGWYGDAVSPQSSRAGTTPGTAPPASPPQVPPEQPSAAPASQPVLGLLTKPVFITTNRRESCNGVGHATYLVNESQLSVTASVTIFLDASEKASASQKSDRYTVDPGNSWQLGCDTSSDGRAIRYVLNEWR